MCAWGAGLGRDGGYAYMHNDIRNMPAMVSKQKAGGGGSSAPGKFRRRAHSDENMMTKSTKLFKDVTDSSRPMSSWEDA